ncbi:MAG: PilZ domain-containing protein [Thermodesulfobacteriota bacterium]
MVIQTKKFSIEDKQRKGSDRIRGTEDENKSRSGVVPSERRKYPRLSVDLPIQYRIDPSTNRNSRAMNLSEGGMLVHSPHQVEIGQRLGQNLFSFLILKSIRLKQRPRWSGGTSISIEHGEIIGVG